MRIFFKKYSQPFVSVGFVYAGFQSQVSQPQIQTTSGLKQCFPSVVGCPRLGMKKYCFPSVTIEPLCGKGAGCVVQFWESKSYVWIFYWREALGNATLSPALFKGQCMSRFLRLSDSAHPCPASSQRNLLRLQSHFLHEALLSPPLYPPRSPGTCRLLFHIIHVDVSFPAKLSIIEKGSVFSLIVYIACV